MPGITTNEMNARLLQERLRNRLMVQYEAALLDATMTGSGWLRVNRAGQLERVDPDLVYVEKRERED